MSRSRNLSALDPRKPCSRREVRETHPALRAGLWLAVVALMLGLTAPSPGAAAGRLQSPSEPPFGLPFLEPPGPNTWLLVQPYGNTVVAYAQRSTTYFAGQGLHFGVDLAARCGTPVVAIGDGVVAKVDAFEHGSRPHNLMIDHANGFASFYGHLLARPDLTPGQPVRRGEVVALVGDPDETCTSRPHLHLEIRNAGLYGRAYNPIPLIAADWDTLALTGSFRSGFARGLNAPRRWQYLDDQPEVIFGGSRLNDYPDPWPLDWK